MPYPANGRANTMDRLHIAYATDNGYLMPTAVSLASAVKECSNKQELAFDILDTGIDDEKWQKFETMVRMSLGRDFGICRHRMDVPKYRKYKSWHGSWGAYARLDLPNILKNLAWCVYADGDTLFINDPLRLREIFDAQFALQAHRDWEFPDGGNIAHHEHWHLQNNLKWNKDDYFCSGFALLNLEWFRQNDASRKCFEFIDNHPTIEFPDQDALYNICKGYTKFLPDEWGRFSWGAFVDEKMGLIHYASDLPCKLMSSKYPDYNDAHKLWFDTARDVYGLGWRDLMVAPSWARYVKKRVIGYALSMLRMFKDCYPITRLSRLNDYLTRHYQAR